MNWNRLGLLAKHIFVAGHPLKFFISELKKFGEFSVQRNVGLLFQYEDANGKNVTLDLKDFHNISALCEVGFALWLNEDKVTDENGNKTKFLHLHMYPQGEDENKAHWNKLSSDEIQSLKDEYIQLYHELMTDNSYYEPFATKMKDCEWYEKMLESCPLSMAIPGQHPSADYLEKAADYAQLTSVEANAD